MSGTNCFFLILAPARGRDSLGLYGLALAGPIPAGRYGERPLPWRRWSMEGFGGFGCFLEDSLGEIQDVRDELFFFDLGSGAGAGFFGFVRVGVGGADTRGPLRRTAPTVAAVVNGGIRGLRVFFRRFLRGDSGCQGRIVFF